LSAFALMRFGGLMPAEARGASEDGFWPSTTSFAQSIQDVDARDKRGHDDLEKSQGKRRA
jgi:hypothetical protein